MKRMLLILSILALASGCSVVRVDAISSATGYHPVLKVDAKPTLHVLTEDQMAEWAKLRQDVRSAVEENSRDLVKDALKCRAAVEKYNAWAETENQRTRETLGLQKEVPDASVPVPGQ